MQTADAAAAIGVPYMRLHRLATEVDDPMLPGSPGSGHYRLWDVAAVIRLAVARHLAGQLSAQPGGSFTDLAVACLDPGLPEPPRKGWAVVTPPAAVDWATDFPAVRAMAERFGAVLLVPFDLDDLVGTHINLDLDYPPPQR